jgi:hypothetical protein
VSEQAKAEPLADEPSGVDAAEAGEPAAERSREAFSPELVSQLRKIVPAVWLAAVLGAGLVSGVELAFLVLAGGVLTGVITFMWWSVQSLTGGSALGFEEALGMGAPSKVEEEKRAVLRALKDLEFERGVGKITPEDYAELTAKYRAEAKRLMQRVDEALAPAREQVERSLSLRLEREGLTGPEATEKPEIEASRPEPEPEPKPEEKQA